MPADLEDRIVAATAAPSGMPDFDQLVERGLRQRRFRRVLTAVAVIVVMAGAGAAATLVYPGAPPGPAILDQPSEPAGAHHQDPAHGEDGFGVRPSSRLGMEQRRSWDSDVPGHGTLHVDEFVVSGTQPETEGWTPPSVMWMRADEPTVLPTVESIRRDFDRVGASYQTRTLKTRNGTWKAIYSPTTNSTTATLQINETSIVKVTAAQMGFDDVVHVLEAIRLPDHRS